MEAILLILLIWFLYALYSKNEVKDIFDKLSKYDFEPQISTNKDKEPIDDFQLFLDMAKRKRHLDGYKPIKTQKELSYRKPKIRAYTQISDFCDTGSTEWIMLKKKYMKSNRWKLKRKQRLKLDNYQCAVCSHNGLRCSQKLEVHHITYDNLGNENINDIVSLCRDHHQQIHDHYGYDYSNIFPINTIRNKK